MTADALRLTVVYERAETGWTTATIPAVPGTISTGRNRREARENVFDALREMLASPVDVPEGATREDISVTLALARCTTAAMTADSALIEYGGRIVAIAGRTRCHIARGELDAATFNFVAVMCLCKREVNEGRLEGPFSSELAAKWARLVLIGPHNLADPHWTDLEVADRLRVPVEQVALARRELGHRMAASG